MQRVEGSESNEGKILNFEKLLWQQIKSSTSDNFRQDRDSYRKDRCKLHQIVRE